jgi:hypothetical protein
MAGYQKSVVESMMATLSHDDISLAGWYSRRLDFRMM